MKNKRKISALLALMILIGAVSGAVGCGDADDKGNTQPKNTSSAEESTASDPNDIPDDLPEADFGGREFTTLTYDPYSTNYYIEQEDGDVINDAVYRRNLAVSERFNVKLKVISAPTFEDANKQVVSSIMAEDEDFQLIENHVIGLAKLATNDLFMNWYDIPHIDFSKPWWAKSTTEDLTYKKDVALFAIGDYSLTSLSGTYCYYFDTKEAVDYNLEDLYADVNDGKWTLDYLSSIVKDVYVDLNNDNVMDGNDYYGVTQSIASPLNAYLWAFGGKIFETDNNGVPQLVYSGERVNNIFDRLCDFCYNNEGVRTKREQYTGQWDYLNINVYAFRDDLSLFAPGTLGNAVSEFRDRTHEYGILPYPKFDENQKDYKTMVDGFHTVSAVPKTISDPEFVGTVVEALNAESHKQVYPAFYEVALKKKYTYDDESVKMLDMIVENRVFDFGYVYDAWKGLSFYFEILIGSGKDNFQSYYASNSGSAIEHYNEVIDFFEKIHTERAK